MKPMIIKRPAVNLIAAKNKTKLRVLHLPGSQYIAIYHRQAETEGPLYADLRQIKGTWHIGFEIAQCLELAPELVPNFLRALDFALQYTFRYSLLEIFQSDFRLNWVDEIVEIRN